MICGKCKSEIMGRAFQVGHVSGGLRSGFVVKYDQIYHACEDCMRSQLKPGMMERVMAGEAIVIGDGLHAVVLSQEEALR